MTDRAKPDGAGGKSGENQKVVSPDKAEISASNSIEQSQKNPAEEEHISKTMTRRDTLEAWQSLLAALQKGSFITAALYERRNRSLGLPVTILSAIVSTAIFASIAQGSTNQWAQIAVGLISVITAVLSALQTYLNYGELAQKHKVAGVKYGALRREIEEVLASDLETQLTSVDLKSIRTRWDEIDQEVPPLPQWIYDKVTREFKTRG